MSQERLTRRRSAQGRIKTLGAPCQRVMGALLSPFLSGPSLSAPLPLPPVPSSALSLPSSQLEVANSIQLWGLGKHCMLPQWGLGQSPSRQTIWCIFESKRAALVAAIKNFCGVLRKNICNFHYFLQKNN